MPGQTEYIRNGFSMSEACVYVGKISRPTMYKLIDSRELKGYRIGRRRYFLKDELDMFLAKQVNIEERKEG